MLERDLDQFRQINDAIWLLYLGTVQPDAVIAANIAEARRTLVLALTGFMKNALDPAQPPRLYAASRQALLAEFRSATGAVPESPENLRSARREMQGLVDRVRNDRLTPDDIRRLDRLAMLIGQAVMTEPDERGPFDDIDETRNLDQARATTILG